MTGLKLKHLLRRAEAKVEVGYPVIYHIILQCYIIWYITVLYNTV